VLGEAGARLAALVVPGGGAFADAVREHDGRFALRAATPITRHSVRNAPSPASRASPPPTLTTVSTASDRLASDSAGAFSTS
jgi:hypothetical protein